jgi:hypothetical protein
MYFRASLVCLIKKLGDSCFVFLTVYILVVVGRQIWKSVVLVCFGVSGQSSRYRLYKFCLLTLYFEFGFWPITICSVPARRVNILGSAGPLCILCFWRLVHFVCTSPVLILF